MIFHWCDDHLDILWSCGIFDQFRPFSVVVWLAPRLKHFVMLQFQPLPWPCFSHSHRSLWKYSWVSRCFRWIYLQMSFRVFARSVDHGKASAYQRSNQLQITYLYLSYARVYPQMQIFSWKCDRALQIMQHLNHLEFIIGSVIQLKREVSSIYWMAVLKPKLGIFEALKLFE